MEIAHHLGTACLFLDLINGNPAGLGVSYKLGSLGSTGWILEIALSLLLFQGQQMCAAYLEGWRCYFEPNLTGTFLNEMCLVLQSFNEF